MAGLVIEALVKIGLNQEEVLDGPIVHTNLPWQIPPLVNEAEIFGVPFSAYIDIPTFVNPEQLCLLWSDSLSFMRNKPDKVLTHAGYINASYAIPYVRTPERQLHLSLPDGFPGGVTDYAGVTLSLECAHLLKFNARIKEFVESEDDYFAILEDGTEVGVKGGLPTLWAEEWDLPVNGMVQEMLRTPRGAVWEGCDYDIIAKLRSVAHEYRDKMRAFEAVDWCLQTLRVIGGARELLLAVRKIKAVSYARAMRQRQLREAVEIANKVSLTDRQRLDALKGILVPEVISTAQFSKLVYPYTKVPPPMLADKVLFRIKEAVQKLHDDEMLIYGPKGTL